MTNKTLSLLFALVFATPLPAQDPHAAQRAELIKLKGQFENAVNAGDLSPLKSVFTPTTHVVFVTADEVSTYEGLTAFYARIREMLGPQGSYKISMTPETTEFHGDLALVRGKSDEDVSADGHTFKLKTIWTGVLREQADGWKLLRLHVSMDPIENPLAELNTLKAKTIGIAMGALAGVILGAGATWWLTRRKGS